MSESDSKILEDALVWPISAISDKNYLGGLIGFGVMGWYLGFQFSGQNPLTVLMGYAYGGLAYAGYTYMYPKSK